MTHHTCTLADDGGDDDDDEPVTAVMWSVLHCGRISEVLEVWWTDVCLSVYLSVCLSICV